MAKWGITLPASEVSDVRSAEDFDALVARALDMRG